MELFGWEEPEIIEEPVLISNSSVFYDDINNPTESLRDIKNMRILDSSRVLEEPDEFN